MRYLLIYHPLYLLLAAGLTLGISSCMSVDSESPAEQNLNLRSSPVTYHLSFDDREFLQEEFIELSGRRSLEERGIEFPKGRFGDALQMSLVPDPPDAHNMTGIDLDLITAGMFNTRPDNQMGYTQPMIWGSGRISLRLGAVAFWAKGELPYHGLIFEQTSVAFGRTERDLMGVYVNRDHQLSAYLRDARYERHTLESNAEWDPSEWNHIVLNWDWASGLELWLNGEVVASSWGDGGWYETAPPGLFHLPMPMLSYDEFYLMDRPLDREEITELITSNRPPENSPAVHERVVDSDRVARSSGLHRNENLPVATPHAVLSITEVWPEYAGDGHIPGWHTIDGRNEMAWPHPYAFFTVIPGDADFHAEKVDLHPSAEARVNYITLTGNLTNVKVQTGRDDMDSAQTLFSVPDDHGFFYGSMIETTSGETFRIPFTEEFGTPGHYSFEGANYRIPYNELFGSPTDFSGNVNLPLSGEKRIQNVGLYYVEELPEQARTGGQSSYTIMMADEFLVDSRWQFKLHATTSRDERRFAVTSADGPGESATVAVGGLNRLNILSDSYQDPTGVTELTLSIPIRTERERETLFVRVHDPALPLRLWNEFAINLDGFNGEFAKLDLRIDFQDLVVTGGDRLWVDIATAGPSEVRVGDAANPALLLVKEVESWLAMDDWVEKQMLVASAQYAKMYGYMPWKFDGRPVDLNAPYALGGPFDMYLPAQAVSRVAPEHFLADFMMKMSSDTFRGGHPANPDQRERIRLENPHNAPDWALYMRDYNQKRQRIVEWWLENQNADGQIGGGWNDDTLFLISGLKDLLYDSPETARKLHDGIHNGFEATMIYADGYCRLYPMDRMHDADFISERYHTVIHNLGQPHATEREMLSAWRVGKPDKTPVNYSEGLPFQSSVNVLHWLWGENTPDEPYESVSLDEIAQNLQLYTSWLDDTYFYSLTGSRIHTTSQSPYGSRNMFSWMLGGTYGPRWDAHPDLSVAWPSGGGANVARVVRYADEDSLEVLVWSFDERRRDLAMRLMRLEDGRYRISIHEDSRGNGQAGEEIWSEEQDLRRFDVVNLPIPSRKGVVVRVEQLERHDRLVQLADLAINPWGAEYENGTVTVRVHNLGNAAAERVRVRLQDGERVVSEQVIDRLEAPVNFIARSITVRFSNVDWTQRLNIVVDPENEIVEILNDNNRARVVTDTEAEFLSVFPTGS